MQPQVNVKSKSLYDTDYHLWIDGTVTQLKSGDFSDLDVENLIEEVESLGKSQKHAVSSYLLRLCEHLLKLKYCLIACVAEPCGIVVSGAGF